MRVEAVSNSDLVGYNQNLATRDLLMRNLDDKARVDSHKQNIAPERSTIVDVRV
jgi:hypothetical protein